MIRRLCAPLLSLLACALGAADDALVIPRGPDARIAEALRPAALAWNHATLSAILAAAPDQPGKAAALAAFALAERAWTGEDISTKDLSDAAHAAVAAGSQDAMIQYLIARFDAGQPQEQLERFRAAAKALAASPYPACRRAICAVRICELVWKQDPHDEGAASKARIEAETLLMAALAEMADDERGATILYDVAAGFIRLDHLLGNEDVRVRLLADLESPRIPEWWRDTLAGIAHIELAWLARGHGWGSSVTAEGWKGFGEQLALARTDLVKAWKAHPDRPQPPTEMIVVAMCGADEDGGTRDWFERTMAAQIDYLPAFTDYFSALQPRWGGSYESMLAVGVAGAETKRYDTEVPWQYVHAVRAIYFDSRMMQQQPPKLVRRRAIYDRCSAIIDEYAKLNPGKDQYYASHRAVLAWICGLPTEADKQLDLADDKVRPGTIDVLGMSVRQLRHAIADAVADSAPPPP